MRNSVSNSGLWARYVVVAACWGTCYLWIKIGLRELSPLQVVFWRLFFSAGFLYAVLCWRKETAYLFRVNGKHFFMMAFLSPFAPFLLVAWAQKYVDSGVASILNGTTLLFGVVLSAIFLKDEPLTKRKIIAVLIGFLGVMLLFQDNLVASFWGGQVAGKLAVLLSSVSYGACSVFARAKFKETPPAVQNTGVTLSAFAYVLCLAFFVEGGVVIPRLPLTWVAVLWLAIFGNVIAYSLYFSLLQQWGVARAASVNYVYPLIGLVLGGVFLGEPMTVSLLLGAVLIVISVVILKKSKGFSGASPKNPLVSEQSP